MTVRVLFLEEDLWLVTPEGRVDVVAARALEDALNGLLDQGHTRLIVDLSAATYIASGGLRVLLMALRRARGMGGNLRLASTGPRILEVFQIAGFDEVFALHPSVDDAVQAFSAA